MSAPSQREKTAAAAQPSSPVLPPIPREGKFWTGIIAIILIVGFFALFLII